MDSTTATTTAALVANLHASADLLASVDLPHDPYIVTSASGAVSWSWYLMHDTDEDGQKSAAAAIIRAIGGRWDKSEIYDGQMVWKQKRDGLEFHVAVTREAVCERIVKGTKKVTIPAKAAQPERVETVEDVEWRCLPLLADDEASA